MSAARKPGKFDLFRAAMRTFYIQGSWNYERMQGLGFCFSLIPILRKLTRSGEELASALVRHLNYFNTNPVMSSYLVGAVARLEEENLSGRGPGIEEIARFKSSASSFFAAVGDELFWGTLRPFSVLLGILAVSAGHAVPGVLLVLVSYNGPHFYFRAKGVFSGYGAGLRVAGISERIRPALLSKLFGMGGALLCGYYAGQFFLKSAAAGPSQGGLFVASVLVSWLLLRRRILRATGIALLLIALAILVSLFLSYHAGTRTGA